MVRVPHFDQRIRQRLAVFAEHPPAHHQRLAGIGAVVESSVAGGFRRAGHIQRPFDRARRTAFDTGFRLRLVETQIEEMLEGEACG